MALWMSDRTGEQWDDGAKLKPGDDGFTRDLATAHFNDNAFSYVGTPNWEPVAAAEVVTAP
ncbi:hypothetical protein [Mesorhizobium sp. 128a]